MFSCLWDLLVLAQETCHLFTLWCAHVPVITMLCVCVCFCMFGCVGVSQHYDSFWKCTRLSCWTWFLLSKVCPTNGRYWNIQTCVCPCQSRVHEDAASSFLHLSAAVCKKMLAAECSTHPYKPPLNTLVHRGSLRTAHLPTQGFHHKILVCFGRKIH